VGNVAVIVFFALWCVYAAYSGHGKRREGGLRLYGDARVILVQVPCSVIPTLDWKNRSNLLARSLDVTS
jgi:hypothetical protein